MSIRCPRCGNSPPSGSYVCTFCGKRLRVERIEKFLFFKRYEAEWSNPESFLTKFYLLIINPAKAFWDINHKRDSAPGIFIILFNSLIYGLFGLALFSHFQIIDINGTPVNPYDVTILFGYFLSVYIAFLAFGFVYYFLLLIVLSYFFIKGANYSIGFTERLEDRFGKRKDKDKKEKGKLAEEASVFSIYKSGTLLQKQEANKYNMLFCAFTPLIITGFIKVLIILIAIPNQQISLPFDFSSYSTVFSTFFQSPTWMVLDILDAIVLIVWIPMNMTIAIRELANSSTYRVYLSSVSIGIITAIIFFLLKPTILGTL